MQLRNEKATSITTNNKSANNFNIDSNNMSSTYIGTPKNKVYGIGVDVALYLYPHLHLHLVFWCTYTHNIPG